jgi:ubiquinone/menaquinone biosynthesis C-methylase UbiE
MSKLSDPAAVAAQYAKSDSFDARVRLYHLYSKTRPTWLEWLFDEIALEEDERVLEVGSGTANVWIENAERIPKTGAIVLSDRSDGMLETARERLGARASRMEFQTFDAQQIPYPDASFDRVIANHMLYHVPDRPRAIAEMARVLGAGGRCHVGTNDWTHQIEIRELIERFAVESSMIRVGRDEAAFDLQTAAEELSPHFGKVAVSRRHDHLYVTDAVVLGDYIRSACPRRPENLARIERLQAHVAQEIDRIGSFHLTVAAGVCHATR